MKRVLGERVVSITKNNYVKKLKELKEIVLKEINVSIVKNKKTMGTTMFKSVIKKENVKIKKITNHFDALIKIVDALELLI